METSEKFDGNLVFVANNQDIQDGQFYFHNDKVGKFIKISRDLLFKLGMRFTAICHLNTCERSENFKRNFSSSMDESVNSGKSRVKKLPHPEVYEILEHGRVQISLLLNSPGGHSATRESIKNYISFNSEKGGETSAFGGNDIQSSAAMLFMQAPKENRYLKSDSDLLFHYSGSSEEMLNIDDGDDDEYPLSKDENKKIEELVRSESRKFEKDEITEVILKGMKGKKRKKLIEVLGEAFKPDENNLDNKFSFTGREAQDLGIAKIAILRSTFERLHQVGMGTYKDTDIDLFFSEYDKRELKEKLFLAIFGRL